MYDIKIGYPLKSMKIIQRFGENIVGKGFYSKIGIPSDLHNGLDLVAPTGTPCYAVHDGTVECINGTTAGLFIRLTHQKGDTRFVFRYMHLKQHLVKTGDTVVKGQLIGICDNTGNSTGAHAHFDMYVDMLKNGVWTREDRENGYNGLFDPTPYFIDDYNLLPVDLRYGKPKNWVLEFMFRFKTPRVHQALIKKGRNPSSIADRELKAGVYGGWDIEDILNPAMWVMWTEIDRSKYKL